MISQLLVLAVLPAAIGYAIYPKLTSRPVAWVIAFAAAAILAGFLAATAQFWWLDERTATSVALSGLAVAIGMASIAGVMLISAFVGLFGGPDAVTPRPLHRIIATGITAITALLLCRQLIVIQGGLA